MPTVDELQELVATTALQQAQDSDGPSWSAALLSGALKLLVAALVAEQLERRSK